MNAGNSLSEQVSVLKDELAVMQQQQRDMNANMENVRSGSRTIGHRVDYASMVNRRIVNTNTTEQHTLISSD